MEKEPSFSQSSPEEGKKEAFNLDDIMKSFADPRNKNLFAKDAQRASTEFASLVPVEDENYREFGTFEKYKEALATYKEAVDLLDHFTKIPQTEEGRRKSMETLAKKDLNKFKSASENAALFGFDTSGEVSKFYGALEDYAKTNFPEDYKKQMKEIQEKSKKENLGQIDRVREEIKEKPDTKVFSMADKENQKLEEEIAKRNPETYSEQVSILNDILREFEDIRSPEGQNTKTELVYLINDQRNRLNGVMEDKLDYPRAVMNSKEDFINSLDSFIFGLDVFASLANLSLPRREERVNDLAKNHLVDLYNTLKMSLVAGLDNKDLGEAYNKIGSGLGTLYDTVLSLAKEKYPDSIKNLDNKIKSV